MRIKQLIVIILIILVVLTALLPQLTHANAIVNESQMDKEVRQGMHDYHIPGLAVGVVKDGRIVFLKGYGKADDTGREVTPETPFILGSVSKPITATAIMQLSEQGKLRLDEPVLAYLPWLQVDGPTGGREATVRDLLRQTSGWSTYDGRAIMAAQGHTAEEIMERQGKLKLERQPGERFGYSNVNYMLLGAIIEQVSGEPYAAYIENYIFQPLDMTDSYADPSTARENGLASGYQTVFGKLMEIKPDISPALVPAGYLAASARDMTHFLLSQMNGGQYRDATVLSAASTGLMQRYEAGFPYGLGWFTTSEWISHGGDAENYHADVMMHTDGSWGIVVLMNTNDVLLTSLYGNGYGDLSFRLLEAAGNGSLFSSLLIEPVKFGAIAPYLNLGIAALAIWLIWSLYRLVGGPNSARHVSKWLIVRGSLLTVIDLIVPLLFLLQFPVEMGAPWRTILRFVPGWGHALFIIPMLFIFVWLLEGLLLFYRLRRTDRGHEVIEGLR
ncbi:serine hydrolase [Paenibacillus sp. 1011MAR3C5]|uniref:serine hydrolase domain-containing protein n=1 Tax=Paenibacillus sp. 1011MAR3C5 TaxID=1675787 RepID=UPI001600A34B|nr:serine hydrolase [Paenibacillus sp. 1011MAR3C5]